MKLIKIWSQIYLIKIKKLFGYKLDQTIIPEGLYCYKFNGLKGTSLINGNSVPWYGTSVCPYYKSPTRNLNACLYCGIITDDIVFDDQCKLCGVNID